jgi:hypothetical protein
MRVGSPEAVVPSVEAVVGFATALLLHGATG